jgi:hypothetical protein
MSSASAIVFHLLNATVSASRKDGSAGGRSVIAGSAVEMLMDEPRSWCEYVQMVAKMRGWVAEPLVSPSQLQPVYPLAWHSV